MDIDCPKLKTIKIDIDIGNSNQLQEFNDELYALCDIGTIN